MNKKGFTLIEVIVSLVIVSIVMAFMLNSLTKIKSSYDELYASDDIEIYRSTLTRIINNDINDNEGIKEIEINEKTMSCKIVLNNEEERKIEIYDVSDEDRILSTLKYYDPNDDEDDDDDELIYMKTLEEYKFDGFSTDSVTINDRKLTILTIKVDDGSTYVKGKNDIVISSVKKVH